MGEQNKKQKVSEETNGQPERKHQEVDTAASTPVPNPLLARQRALLQSLTKEERQDFFSTSISPERRAEIWMRQADIGEELIDTFSWATPDDRAIRILRYFAPIVECGCGANAYWCRIMIEAGIDCIGFDSNPSHGGRLTGERAADGENSIVRQGGPEVLSSNDLCSGRTLFLCYPDEHTETCDSEIGPQSLGASCLDHFRGEHIVHVGELYGDTPSMDQAPWGRSSGADFQQRLATEYHCLLKAQLTCWLHVQDTISVWKRSQTCSIVLAAEEEDDEEDEEIQYRYIPAEERLSSDIASPSMAHLL